MEKVFLIRIDECAKGTTANQIMEALTAQGNKGVSVTDGKDAKSITLEVMDKDGGITQHIFYNDKDGLSSTTFRRSPRVVRETTGD